MYLSSFHFPSGDCEFDILLQVKRKCYTTFYPFQVLPKHQLETLSFEPVTILAGGNGSGKSTALNVMAETLQAKRDSAYNRSDFYEQYLGLCSFAMSQKPQDCRIITSDDVFDYLLRIRDLNNGIDRRRQEVFDEYINAKNGQFRFRSLADYDELKKANAAKRSTQSKYTRDHLMANVKEQSNGESAFRYFTERMKEGGLYFLDEPENSLSFEKQTELASWIHDSARFFGCQFIIATHSPCLLALQGARIYDLDDSACIRPWTEIKSVRQSYNFFMLHAKEFQTP